MLRYAVSFLAVASFLVEFAAGEQCLSDPAMNGFFEVKAGGEIPLEDSCCQFDVCGLPCPKDTPEPGMGEC